MKFFLNSLALVLISLLYENSAFGLSNYKIKEICQNRQKKSACIKYFKQKKLNLLKGNQIEIPVIPFKK